MEPLTPRAVSGRPIDELTLERARSGELTLDDIRIHPDTLLHQAAQADRFGNSQLAESLRRGAEMAMLGDEELMRLYEALRPGRSTAAELREIADGLAAQGMPRCAELVSEAADVYARCGLAP
ncbi:diol dehydratase small subunit [Nonomuraea harbinensis]|uniref:Diol dehydratase small subunit n=1 Tax=Nonomuraea harbinensis TaxID=1286938 RepID=A0ABW1BZN3_9ACTN|nr:diol dehydratase small subunit [Nonomuraea harbinensis]